MLSCYYRDGFLERDIIYNVHYFLKLSQNMGRFISEKFGFDTSATIHLKKKLCELPGQPSYTGKCKLSTCDQDLFFETVWNHLFYHTYKGDQ